MKCITCEENYKGDFVKDFVDGICLPCRANFEYDKECLLDEEELKKYNKSNNKSFEDINQFCNACRDRVVIAEELKHFPRLLSYYEDMRRIEYELENM